MNYKKFVDELVNKGADNIKKKTIMLNGGKPILGKSNYEVKEGEPKYFKIDKYGRSTGGIALVTPNTLPLITDKTLTYPDPYGWTKNLENKYLFERCHIIAYNLSAQTTEKENLFIGTNDLNRSMMKDIEIDVNNHIKDYNYKIIYKVTVKYKDANQIPIGILIEAQALDNDYSVCSFCYNIEKKVKFDYSNGNIIYDNRGLNSKNKEEKIKNEELNENTKTAKKKNQNRTNYFLNIKTKVCHYNKNCLKLKNISPKYIQSTRTTRQVIADNGFTFCDKCKKEVE